MRQKLEGEEKSGMWSKGKKLKKQNKREEGNVVV